MIKSKRKERELENGEKYYRIEYKSKVDKLEYWTKIAARNKEHAQIEFERLYSVDHIQQLTRPCCDK